MRRMRATVVLGLLGVAGLATGCGEDKELRYYLGANGRMHKWQVDISKAICQLEENTTGLDQNLRVCPGGPGSITPPPSYPPK